MLETAAINHSRPTQLWTSPALYKAPLGALSTLIRSPLPLEFLPLPNLANCSPEFVNSGDLSPCIQEAIYHHNLFKWFTSSSSTSFRTRPSSKHTGATFFLVSGNKSGEHPASESQSATCLWPIFFLFQEFFQIQILYQIFFLVYLSVYRSDLVDSFSY